MKQIGLFKRLLVILYDGLLLTGVVFVACLLVMSLYFLLCKWLFPSAMFVDPATLADPKMIELSGLGRTIGSVLTCLTAIIVSFLFYGWFWTHGGQTLGMRAWHLYLIKPDGKFIDWRLAFKRYWLAILSWTCLGLGFLWIMVSPSKRAWHDSLTGTQIVHSRSPKHKSDK